MEKNLIEVTRSFSMKKNLGNYETADFFCSQKVECVPKDAEKMSELAYTFCKSEVVKSLNSFMGERNKGVGDYEGKILPMGKPSRTTKEDVARIIENSKPKYRATDRMGGKEEIVLEELAPY